MREISNRLVACIGALAVAAILFFSAWSGGCSRPEPDYSIVHYTKAGDEPPFIRAARHTNNTPGALLKFISGESMEPMIVQGDFVVIDTKFPFEDIKPGMVISYQAVWRDQSLPWVSHMAAKRYPDGSWIMDGINNVAYENGRNAMTKEHYRGRIIAIYTARSK